MTGKDFLDKINRLDNCISALDASLSINDGSKLSLTDCQQEEIHDYLKDYRRMLLESDLS